MKSLSEVVDSLDDRFVQTHRACVINSDRAEEINYKQKYILFDNGIKINLVSNNYKIGEKYNVN
jgi:DNA-binding LytR/AlgR family response regulator